MFGKHNGLLSNIKISAARFESYALADTTLATDATTPVLAGTPVWRSFSITFGTISIARSISA